MGIYDFDPKLLELEAEEAAKNKALLGIAGEATQGLLNVQSPAEMMLGQSGPRANVRGMFDAAAGSIQDPLAKKLKAMEMAKLIREGKSLETQEQRSEESRRGDSPRSIGARAAYGQYKLSVNPTDTEADLIERYGPISKYAQGMFEHQNKLGEIAANAKSKPSSKQDDPLYQARLDYMQDRRERADEDRNYKREQALYQNTGKLSDKLGDSQVMGDAIRNVETKLGNKLDDYTVDPKGNLTLHGQKVDLPGVNVPLFGRVSAYSDKASDLNTGMAKIFNITIKDRSGAAVTNNEMERIKEEFASGKYNTEAQLIRAMQDYKKAVISELQNREAAFEPKVVQKYRDQGGFTSHKLSGASSAAPDDTEVAEIESAAARELARRQQMKSSSVGKK